MTFKQRNKIALKVFRALCTSNYNDILLSNDTILINGDPLYFSEILAYYYRLAQVQK